MIVQGAIRYACPKMEVAASRAVSHSSEDMLMRVSLQGECGRKGSSARVDL